MKSVEFKVYFQTGYFSELYPMFNPSEFLAVNNTKKLFGLGVILMNIEIVESLKIPEHHKRLEISVRFNLVNVNQSLKQIPMFSFIVT